MFSDALILDALGMVVLLSAAEAAMVWVSQVWWS
jgi:hypothetical protein